MIYALILGFHLVVCVALVLAVLLQSGKGGGLAGAFGGTGGAGQTLFGGRGAATFLSKATTVLGISFMTTSLVLALLSGQGGEQSILREAQPTPGTVPPPITAEPLQIPGLEDAPALETEGLETTPAGGEEAAPAGGNESGAAEGSDPEASGGN